MPTAPWHSGVARSSRNSRFNLGSMPQSTGLKVTLDVPLVFPKSSCARRPASFVLLATQPGKLVVRHPGRSNPVNASRPLIRQRGSSRGSAVRWRSSLQGRFAQLLSVTLRLPGKRINPASRRSACPCSFRFVICLFRLQRCLSRGHGPGSSRRICPVIVAS